MGFFNTLRLTGKKLTEAEAKTENQNDLILKLLKELQRYPLTPFDVQANIKRVYGIDYPITSVRRALTELTKAGHLVKSDKAEAKGIYQVANHCWQYNTPCQHH